MIAPANSRGEPPMPSREAGEAVGKGIAAALHAATNIAVIAACGRYMGWW